MKRSLCALTRKVKPESCTSQGFPMLFGMSIIFFNQKNRESRSVHLIELVETHEILDFYSSKMKSHTLQHAPCTPCAPQGCCAVTVLQCCQCAAVLPKKLFPLQVWLDLAGLPLLPKVTSWVASLAPRLPHLLFGFLCDG